MVCVTLLVSGCGGLTTECDWTETLSFNDQHVVDYLIEHDRALVEAIVAHNEKRDTLCQ